VNFKDAFRPLLLCVVSCVVLKLSVRLESKEQSPYCQANNLLYKSDTFKCLKCQALLSGCAIPEADTQAGDWHQIRLEVARLEAIGWVSVGAHDGRCRGAGSC
jgi:hypothetical protein